MLLTYFGHSAFQIEGRGATLLLDPFISNNPMADGVVTPADLHPDVILVTHAHSDHWGDTPALATGAGALVIANHEITQYLRSRHHHEHVVGMNTGGSKAFPWGRVTLTDARHSSSFPDGSYGGNPNGFLLEIDGTCIYALGDTSPFAEMAWIGEGYDVDIALVPVGDCFTMGPAASLRAVRMIRPRLTIPVHYNTFPAIEIDVEAWAHTMEAAGFAARVLRPGETFEG
jgi:L-ascorbate metabolism protein UlaG (beta-lactamase superfamily)